MQVAYEHPPRKLSFYLRFLITLLIICIPIIIIQLIWYSHVSLTWLIGLIMVTIALFIMSIAKSLLKVMIAHEDYEVPKDMDISKLDMDVPDVLEDTKILLELEGFERLGEMETYHSSLDKPIPTWAFSKANGKIIADTTTIGNKPFMMFATFAENGVVMTYYPVGHRVNLENARFSSVSSSIEDTYKYHLKQLQRMRPKMGRLIPVKSIKHYSYLERKFISLTKVHYWHSVVDQFIGLIVLSVIFAFGHALFASWWFPRQYFDLFAGWRFPATAIVFVGSLVFGVIVENRKNGIKNIDKA